FRPSAGPARRWRRSRTSLRESGATRSGVKNAAAKAVARRTSAGGNGKRPTRAASAVAAPSRRDDLQIGGRLKHARLLAGVRMRELALKVGCTESMISKIENARVVPSLPMLK